ncbi:MAG: hypothetical protein ACLU9S_07905 [Oscillospiraceae bacterium]
MSEPVQNFRTAFHGFNREDVVRFLETATARHTAEVNQLRDEIARLEGDLSLLRMRSGDGASQEGVEATGENARLKAQVENGNPAHRTGAATHNPRRDQLERRRAGRLPPGRDCGRGPGTGRRRCNITGSMG